MAIITRQQLNSVLAAIINEAAQQRIASILFAYVKLEFDKFLFNWTLSLA